MSVFLVLIGTAVMSLPALAGGVAVPDMAYTYDQAGLYTEISADRNLVGAQKFIEDLSSEGIAFLKDTSLSDTQRKDQFKKLLTRNFDIEKIGRFSMGRYWRGASPAQQKKYQALFKNMIVDVYSQRFSEYNGQTLEVREARDEGSKDIIVSSKLVGAGEPEVSVDWRVRPAGSSFKVIDVVVEGVSMAVTQRSEFASVIQRGGGDVDVLIVHLEK